ncbi:hypothetical protein [Saprospira grandis]|uniref:hypothetical protein n=1 Tax=Saprospira grandis TaxID=1008 RepID=UPI0022DCFDB5|nr:hypothetical protein [Saprospira grandis]WBM74829.1 hypothetical protein OP864_01045 [Saprospira grandis]
MRGFFLLIFLAIGFMGQAQSLAQLDQKKGFKEFQLGDSYTKWSDALSYKGSYSDGAKEYLYTGACCQQLFNYELDRILLRFYEGKLVGIHLRTEKTQESYEVSGKYTNWQIDDLENLVGLFSNLFGKPSDVGKNEDGVSFFWQGKKVLLVATYKYLGVSYGDRLEVKVLDDPYFRGFLGNGF